MMEKDETKIIEFKEFGIVESVDWERTKDITAQEVKTTKGMEYLTEEQAEEVAQFIKTFAMLLNTLIDKQIKEENNSDTKIIDLYEKEHIKKAA
ncbi:MAG: hypothetical protein H0U95_02115 [Bacteroidetes bacterium]|nr:hypothetical protein [Bacteroidota bacterium]